MGFQELQLSPGAAMPIEALADVGDLSQAWDGGGVIHPGLSSFNPSRGPGSLWMYSGPGVPIILLSSHPEMKPRSTRDRRLI